VPSAVLDGLRAWWSVDRIRASPHEGRLYRLRPGWIVRVGDHVAEVESVSPDSSTAAAAGAAGIVCRCRDAAGHVFELRVSQPQPGAPPIVDWHGGGGVVVAHPMGADDVTFLPCLTVAARPSACVVQRVP
jgi:hypothetical protein